MRRRAAFGRLALLGAAPVLASWPARAANARAGFVYIGPRGDWGWNESHAIAAPSLARLSGAPFEASLPESTDYDSGKDTPETLAYAKAIEGQIAGGAGLVFSTSVGHDPFLRAAAIRHPDVAFRQASLLPMAGNPTNLGSQNALINQGHFVNGVAAGLCTRTNRMGFVAGLPFGSVLLNVNSFLLGCRRTNPRATVQVIFTGGWEETARDVAATNALVDAGCDVITCHLDAPKAVITTAEGRGARTCGHAFDQAPLAPRGYVTGADYRWGDMFTGFVEARRIGSPLPAFLTGGYDRDYVRSSPFGAGATAAAIAAANGAIDAMKRNEPIFVGPLDDNAGKRVVPAGTMYGSYAEQLQRMDYLLDGVIGQVR